MARLERPLEKSKNPTKFFFKWKSDQKCFEFYDKEKKKNVKVELPFSFLFLEHYHCVKGWHKQTNKGIFSNEVYALGSEELNVKTFGNNEIAKGLYKDIKEKVKLSDGHYCRSIYIMLGDGTIANLQLKGVGVGGFSSEVSVTKEVVDGYSEFYNKNKHLLDNQFVTVKTFADGKKGGTKFSIPVFEIGNIISREEDSLANDATKEMQEYMNEYFGKTKSEESKVLEEERPEEERPEETYPDDLSF